MCVSVLRCIWGSRTGIKAEEIAVLAFYAIFQEFVLHFKGNVKSTMDFSRRIECWNDKFGNCVKNVSEGRGGKLVSTPTPTLIKWYWLPGVFVEKDFEVLSTLTRKELLD